MSKKSLLILCIELIIPMQHLKVNRDFVFMSVKTILQKKLMMPMSSKKRFFTIMIDMFLPFNFFIYLLGE